MTTTIGIDEAQVKLKDLIAQLGPDDEVVILENDRPVARLAALPSTQRWPCKAGSAKDTVHHMAPDFDAPLDDFREYME